MKCAKLKCEFFNSEMEMNCCYSDDPDKTVLCMNSLNTAFYKEGKTERNPNDRTGSEQVKSLLSDVIGLYISEDGMVILAEKRYDGDKRLAGRVVYQTKAYRSRFPNDIPIGTFSNKWDEDAFKLLVK